MSYRRKLPTRPSSKNIRRSSTPPTRSLFRISTRTRRRQSSFRKTRPCSNVPTPGWSAFIISAGGRSESTSSRRPTATSLPSSSRKFRGRGFTTRFRAPARTTSRRVAGLPTKSTSKPTPATGLTAATTFANTHSPWRIRFSNCTRFRATRRFFPSFSAKCAKTPPSGKNHTTTPSADFSGKGTAATAWSTLFPVRSTRNSWGTGRR